MEKKNMELPQSSLMIVLYNIFEFLKFRDNHTKHDHIHDNPLIRTITQIQRLPISPTKSQKLQC
jgi:hypothetical protein